MHPMDKNQLLKLINREAIMVWDSLCEIHPRLAHFDLPQISLNPYTWKMAGSCLQEHNRVELGFKFFKSSRANFNTMIDVILPHELIHQADYNLFGESDKPCGHGTNWRKLMLDYGLPDNPYHSMDIKR